MECQNIPYMPEIMPDRMLESMSDRMPEKTSEYVSDRYQLVGISFGRMNIHQLFKGVQPQIPRILTLYVR